MSSERINRVIRVKTVIHSTFKIDFVFQFTFSHSESKHRV